MMCRAIAVSAVVFCLACTSRVSPSNPFDPGTPTDQQAKATVTGVITGEAASGSTGPLAGAVVSLDGTGLSAASDATGSFTLGNVPPGSYVLRAHKDGYVDVSAPALALGPGETRNLTNPFLLAVQRGQLHGIALLGDVPAGGDASGTLVSLLGTPFSAISSRDGTFLFDHLAVGTYQVDAHRDGYLPRTYGTVTVTAGQTVDVGSATLSKQSGSLTLIPSSYTKSTSIQVALSAEGETGFHISEDPAFADASKGDVSGSPWRAYTSGSKVPFTLSDHDGTHTVYVVFWDGLSQSHPSSSSIVLDRAAPPVPTVVVADGSGYSSSAMVTLFVSAADLAATGADVASGLAQLQIANSPDFSNSVTIPYATQVSWGLGAPTVDGPKTVYLKALDGAGNASAAATATVILDRLSPDSATLTLASLDSPQPGFSSSPLVSATLSANDANGGPGGSALRVRISNVPGFTGAAWQPLTSPIAWLLTPGDGVKTVYAQFMDPAGNQSVAVSASITLLTVPPSGSSLSIDGGAASTSLATAALTIGCVGASQMAISTDGFATPPTWVSYATSANIQLPDPDQQQKTVSVRFRNASGVEGASLSASIFYDHTAPATPQVTLSGTRGDGALSSSITATPAVLLSLGGAAADTAQMAVFQTATTCAAGFASSTWQPFASSSTVVLTGAQGAKKICALVRDATGNFLSPTIEANFGTATLTLDPNAPTPPSILSPQSGYTNQAQINVNILASTDTLATSVHYQCLGGQYATWTDCATSASPPAPGATLAIPFNNLTISDPRINPNGAGDNNLQIRARDDAYNASAAALINLKYLPLPPSAPTLTSLSTRSGLIDLAWTPVAGASSYRVLYGSTPDLLGSGAGQVVVAVPGGSASSYEITGLNNGSTYYASVQAVDPAGNLSDPAAPQLASPNLINPRLLSTYGSKPLALGKVGNRVYLGVNQGVLQLDGSSDGASPTVTGRAQLPNGVPLSAVDMVGVPAAPSSGCSGDFLFVAQNTLQNDLQIFGQPNGGVVVLCFPAPTAGQVSSGQVVTTLAVNPAQLVLSADQLDLYAVENTDVEVFSLANPAQPLRTARVPLPVNFNGQQIYGAGLVGGTLQVVLPASDPAQPGSTVPQLWSLDASRRDALGTPSALGFLKLNATTSFTINNGVSVSIRGGQVYASYYTSTGLSCPYPSWINSYAPGQLVPTTTLQLAADASPMSRSIVQAPSGNLYVFGGFSPSCSTGSGPALLQVRVSGATLTLGSSLPNSSSSSGPRVGLAMTGSDGKDRVWGVDYSGVERWRDDGSATQTVLPGFSEPAVGVFALGDGFVFMVSPASITAVDVSNPMIPKLAAITGIDRSVHPATEGYSSIAIRGDLLFAGVHQVGFSPPPSSCGVDIFRIGRTGSLTRLSTAHRTTTPDAGDVAESLAVSGRFLFVGSNSLGISAYDISNPAAPTWLAHDGDLYGLGLAAAGNDVFASDTAGHFQRSVFNASGTPNAFSNKSTLIYSALGGRTLSVRDGIAVMGSPDGSSTVVVPANPAGAPYFTQVRYPVTGTVLMQHGYFVGLPTSTSTQDGLEFVANGSGRSDGTLPFQACPQGGSVASKDGLYYVACGSNGLQIIAVAHQLGGRLAAEYGGAWSNSFYSGGRPLVDDGSYLLTGANQVGVTSYPADASLWQAQLDNFVSSGTLAPGLIGPGAIAAPTGVPQFMTLVGGTNYVANAYNNSSNAAAQVAAYDVSRAQGGSWTVRTSYAFPGNSGTYNTTISAQPVSDGARLYVPFLTYNSGVYTAGISVLSAGDFDALSLYGTATDSSPGYVNFSALAVHRGRLYAGVGPYTVDVFDATTPSMTALPSVSLYANAGNTLSGLAVAGQLLAATSTGATGSSLMLVKLGTNGDGASAVQIASLSSPFTLSAPTLSGDLLIVRMGTGVATYDLRSVWAWLAAGGTSYPYPAPTFLGSVAIGGNAAAGTYPATLQLNGPWLSLLSTDLRVFDLR